MGKIKIACWAFALTLIGLNASALVEISALGGYATTSETYSGNPPNPTVNGKGSFTYGAQVDLKIPESSWGLGAGLWEVTATAEQVVTGGLYDVTFSVPYLQLPVTARYNFADIFSVGLGMYYAFPAGNVTQTGTTLGVPVNQTQSFSAANVKSDDYGVIADAAVYIPVGAVMSITGRLAYEAGLENDTTVSGSTVHANELLIYAGLAFGI